MRRGDAVLEIKDARRFGVGFGNLRKQARKIIVLRVGLTPETSAPIDRDGSGMSHPFEHEYAAEDVMLHLTGKLKRNN